MSKGLIEPEPRSTNATRYRGKKKTLGWNDWKDVQQNISLVILARKTFQTEKAVFLQEEENGGMANRLKELEDERNRLARTSSQQQIQIDKFKKLAEDAKGKAESLETQLSSTRKVVLALLSNLKKNTTKNLI